MGEPIKPDIVVNVIGETCPIPLIEMRKAVMKANKGDVIEVKGTHEASQQEIPMAVESLHLDLLSSEKDAEGTWHIFIKK
jgi:tRNA 2-thiouridine synthesizing protein A